ncbi:hypothetical protein SKAU_G00204920 [Synaphobranchus kaupii]|uniref:Uncharacterized protein n=1 Tax=Synaphobranchus kaupii TaxID=118154 RepID=A0A9Q1IYK1_SYNKA|nr:hypothetical protein SKAU_G00204920 [Synaphobranchus kaupii]
MRLKQLADRGLSHLISGVGELSLSPSLHQSRSLDHAQEDRCGYGSAFRTQGDKLWSRKGRRQTRSSPAAAFRLDDVKTRARSQSFNSQKGRMGSSTPPPRGSRVVPASTCQRITSSASTSALRSTISNRPTVLH